MKSDIIKGIVAELSPEQQQSICKSCNIPTGKTAKETAKNLSNAIAEGQVRVAVDFNFKQPYPDAANPDILMPSVFRSRHYNYKDAKVFVDANATGTDDPTDPTAQDLG